MTATLRFLGMLAANIVTLLCASYVALQVFYPMTSAFGSTHARFVAAHVVPYLIAGMLISKWSPDVLYVLVPAAITIGAQLTIAAMAVYSASGGNPGDMMTFVFRDRGSVGVVVAIVLVAGAGFIGGKRWRYRSAHANAQDQRGE